MKNNKKLVVLAGAAALGLVAATGVTSGFAWFAVNNSVSATSLNVSAKSNAAYLLIGTSDNSSTKTGSADTIPGIDPGSTTVYPAAFNDTGAKIEWKTASVAANKFYTATVNNRNEANPNDDGVEYTSLSEVFLSNADYFVHYTFWLTLGEGSKNYSGTLDITMAKDNNGGAPKKADHDAVSAAVYFDSAAITNFNTTPDTPLPVILEDGSLTHQYSGVALTAATAKKVDIFMFIDGTNTDVKSATDLSTLIGDVDFTFAIA